jgi:mono/diheme cytochrome c family protein
MRPIQILSLVIGFQILTTGILTVRAQPSNVVTTAPVYVPDYSHANSPLPDGIIAWDATQKSLVATNDQHFAWFNFSFTNISPGIVTILSGRGSCSCTTVQLPATPWLVPAGGTGEFTAKIDLFGKTGSIFKQAIISTDKGTKNLALSVNILPAPPVPPLSEADRARGMAAAKVDRQAVFKGDCVTCHAKGVEGVYGQQLFVQVCAVCHEATPRATMVPDLHNLKDPTSQDFWRTWITSGKAGTLMPAFATSQGGPLSNMQIESLAAYLNAVIPPHAATAAAK